MMQIYYDGVLKGTHLTNTHSGTRNTDIWFGTNGDKDGDPYTFGNCWLDNFRIWQTYTADVQFVLNDMNAV